MSNYTRKGYNPKSLDNLKRMSDRTPNERRELGRKGGRKSANLYQERRPNVLVIEKCCPLCNGSITIKANTLEAVKIALEQISQLLEDEKRIDTKRLTSG